jgi:hypothetical protein
MKKIPAFLSTLAAAMVLAAPAPAAPVSGSEDLSALINRELRAGGSWFTPAEQAAIVRKCGYAPGEWDGFEVRLTGGKLHCSNGRVVEDQEIRGLIRSAEPRIEARVKRVMARSDVRAAISRVAEAAAAEAMEEMRRSR